MKSIKVQSSAGSYGVYIGKDLVGKVGQFVRRQQLQERGLSRKNGVFKNRGGALKQPGGKMMVVTQAKVARHYLAPLQRSLEISGFKVVKHVVPDGEKAKSERELFRLYQVLLKNYFERSDSILALGGGVVGDLAGFCASTYMRGIRFINIGTTLLAQVDSSIGGKTGINLREGKNLVGTFYPPHLVIADIGVLKTLPMREFLSSLAEVVKYGMIRDARLFRLLESKTRAILARDSVVLGEVVAACARIKSCVVGRDEKEVKGERMILNYGHTFAHAFEQALGYQGLMHGEAVSVGMICAAHLAVLMGCFSKAEAHRQRDLLNRLKLPVSLVKFRISPEKILRAMMRDKKKNHGRLRFVLPERIGCVQVRDDVPLPLVCRALLYGGAVVLHEKKIISN